MTAWFRGEDIDPYDDEYQRELASCEQDVDPDEVHDRIVDAELGVT